MSLRRLTRWLWLGRSAGARTVRALLLPSSALYGAVVAVRTRAYEGGRLAAHQLPLPTVAVGNLAVGGTGKTPLASWIAERCLIQGVRPGILLRGYGGDEVLVHECLTPEAVVVADPDRRAGAERARALGARILVLDDAFQRLDVRRDMNVLLVAAEQEVAAPWLLPAGPWREGWGGARRATLVVVTRKRVPAAAAARLADWVASRVPGTAVAVAHLGLGELVGMRTAAPEGLEALRGRRVVVASGIGDPASFGAQIGALGADVEEITYPDHHAYRPGDVARLVRAAAAADYLIVTEKDAVKLRHQWPVAAREPLVALLTVQWERGGDVMRALLDEQLSRARRSAEES